MSFGSRLRQRREQLGMTQQQLADALGITRAAIGNYEQEVSSPKADILYDVFDALKCDANFLFQDEMSELSTKPVTHPLLQLYDSMSREEQEQLMEFLPLYSALALVDRTKIQGRVEEILESPKYSQNKKLKNA